MASYLDTVLALNPVFFFRLDSLFGSTVMPDASPNGFDGTYFPTAGFGLASPIETDPASKAISGPAGKLTVASAPDSDIRSSFTWLAWGYNSSGAIFDQTLLCRSGQAGLGGSSWMGFGGTNTAHAELSISGTDYTLNYTVLPDRWYFFALTRNTNVMRLYVNGVLRAERTDLDPGDISATNWSSDGWYIGRAQSTGFAFHSAGTDEVAVLDYAVTDGQQKAVYESALNLLPVSVTFGARATLELDTDAISPADFPFLHNFVDALEINPRPVIETLSFKTHVNQSVPDFQQRINAQPHHVDRTLEYAVTATEKLARARMNSSLWRPAEYYKLPVSIDWSVLTAQASSGANMLSLDTTLRDFEVGSYCVAWADSFDATTYQFFKITSITDSELGISPNVGTTLPIGSGVAPARIACLEGENDDIDSHAIDKQTDQLRFTILSTELSTRRLTTYVPATTYKSIEVFNLEKTQVAWLNPRRATRRRRIEGTEIPGGNDYYRALDTGSPGSIPISLTLTSRAARAEFYGWLNARQGKQNPVWMSTNENDFTLVSSLGSGVIKVTSSRYKASYNLHYGRRDLQLVYSNGSVSNHRITAAVDNGDGTENLTLSPGPSSTIVKISFLTFCTAPDNFELKHYNNPRDSNAMVTQCDFVFTELLTTPA